MTVGSKESVPYRELIETAGDAICTIDASGVYLFINTAGAARVGRTPAAMIGTTMWDVFPKATADAQMAILREVIQSGRGTVVETLVEIRGQLRWHRTSIEPLRITTGPSSQDQVPRDRCESLVLVTCYLVLSAGEGRIGC
jgi:PAS domain S-box-containing protein